MERKRELDTAKIRTVAVEVECIVHCLKSKDHDLHAAFDKLHDEIYCADPEADREFDRFLLEIAHVNGALNNLHALLSAAKTMQRYGLPLPAPASAADPVQRQSLVPSIAISETVASAL